MNGVKIKKKQINKQTNNKCNVTWIPTIMHSPAKSINTQKIKD